MFPDARRNSSSDSHEIGKAFGVAEGIALAEQPTPKVLQTLLRNSALVAVSFSFAVDGESCYVDGLGQGATLIAEVFDFALGAWPAIVDVVPHDFFKAVEGPFVGRTVGAGFVGMPSRR